MLRLKKVKDFSQGLIAFLHHIWDSRNEDDISFIEDDLTFPAASLLLFRNTWTVLYTCREMHLSLPLTQLHQWISNCPLNPPSAFVFRQTRMGGLVSTVSPLCNSMHYMPSLPSVCVRYLKRRFRFPRSPFVLVAPSLMTTQAETDP